MDIQQLLAEILTRQSEALSKIARPYVIADVYPRRSVNLLHFRIRNVGYTPAFNIRAKIEPPVPFRSRLSSDLGIFTRPIAVLGPREEISFVFDSAIELFQRENAVVRFDASIQYEDADGVQYRQLLHIDIDMLKNLAIELPMIDKATDELERIHRDLETIARYVDQLRSQEMLKEWREPEKEKAETPSDKESSSGS